MEATATTNDVSSSNNGNAGSSNPLHTNPAAPKPEFAMWNSVGPTVNRLANSTSFKSEDGVSLTSRSYSEQQLGVKEDMVYGLMSLLDNHSREEMTRTLLAMSHSSDSCDAMRQSGCISLLVQLIHCEEEERAGAGELRTRASQALHNLIHCHQDDKEGRREVRVLRLLEKTQAYAAALTEATQHSDQEEIGQIVAALMKLSFDEEHRAAMSQLGALHTLAKLIQVDTRCHGLTNKHCILLRRYAGMSLTNLTFGHSDNKSTLCCLTDFMKALVLQLSTPSDHLRQVTASVLRNLSWRPDAKAKQILREVGSVPALTRAAMEATKESTLKSILSALWNFSSHCNNNKVEICQVEGALVFLVEKMKSSPATSLCIVENAGGVIRNISSHISVNENYRQVLRSHGALPLLLEQLRSPSLTVVSNACGTLWNLSAHCPQDQATLCSLGAGPMLSCLIHSRHKMIAMGASAALKNLLAAQPASTEAQLFDSKTRGMPSLLIRKRRALEKELDANLAETCDNIDNMELASPLTPQCSTPVSTLSSHQDLMTSTPISSKHQDEDSSVHNTSDSNNTEDHNTPLTRSPSPSISYHNNTTPTSTSHYNNPAQDKENTSPLHSHHTNGDTQSNSSHTKTREENISHKNSSCENREEKENVSQYSNSKSDASEKSQYSCNEKSQSESQKENNSHFNISRNEESEKSHFNRTRPEEVEKSHYNNPQSFEPNKSQHTNSIDGDLSHMVDDLNLTSESEREQLSFSKMEEPYFHPHLDEDSNEPINLDQPTNYSLRYSEKQKRLDARMSEGTRSEHRGQAKFADDHEEAASDCLKTFCTEDTPYNFSNSTSLSDLRITEGEGGELSACKTPEDSKPCSGRSSPHRGATRLSKLSPALPHTPRTPPREDHHCDEASTPLRGGDCDETPLMFSRCSSLGSVSSCNDGLGDQEPSGGQGVAPEDRYSVVSEFSRMTSGMISPSDLPDSPLQTAPVSPSPRGANKFSFPPSTPGTDRAKYSYPPPVSGVGSGGAKVGQRPSVFEDTVATYQHDDEEEKSGGEGGSGDSHPPAGPPPSLPPPPSAKDELKCYAVEESPINLTAWSSLSDLTINTATSVSASATQPLPGERQFGGDRSFEPSSERRLGRTSGGESQFVRDAEEREMFGHHQSGERSGKKIGDRSRSGRESLGIIGGDGERIVGGHLGRDLCASGDLGPACIVGERLIGGVAGREEEKEEEMNDEDILAACIQAGMESAKSLTLKKKEERGSKSSSHHLDSSHEDEPDDDDSVLAQCIQLGMSSSTQHASNPGPPAPAAAIQRGVQSQGNASGGSAEESQQTTKQSAVPPSPSKRTLTKPVVTSAGANPGLPSVELRLVDLSDEDILQQCILEGMSSYVAEATRDQTMLAECIRAGMNKFKQELSRRQLQASSSSSDNGPQPSVASQSEDRKAQGHCDSAGGDFDLDQWANDVQDKDSALLLEQCIEAGIPFKSKNAPAPSVIPPTPHIPKTGGDPTEDDIGGDTRRSEGHLAETTTSGEQRGTTEEAERESQTSGRNEIICATNAMDDRTKVDAKETNMITCPASEATSRVESALSNSLTKELLANGGMAENKLLSSLIKSSGSLERSMERSWLLTENLNDDLCEGMCTSGTQDDFCRDLMTDQMDEDLITTAPKERIGNRSVFELKKGSETEQSRSRKSSVEDFDSKRASSIELKRCRDLDEMKASLNHTWSEDSSTSCPTVSLSPPSCLKPKQTFVYPGERKGFPDCDSVSCSPVRKSVAKVNPFPETAKHVARTREDGKSPVDVIDELIKKHTSGNATNHRESIVMQNVADTMKCSPHILELECGKLGFISSLEFEDLNAVKPPSMMDSVTCMDRSIYNKALIGSMTSMHSSINLDNVKPPSYFDEVSLLLEDSGLDASICNIDSIVSEVADHDEDLTLVEDEIPLDPQLIPLDPQLIPLDPQLVSLEHREAYQASPRLQRKVTPKQKRTLSKERYNTYTIQHDHSPSPPPVDRLTPKQRREQDRQRYSTRTIQDDEDTLVNHDTFVVTDDTLTLMSGNSSEVEDLELDEEPPPPPRPHTGGSPARASRLQAPRPVLKTPASTAATGEAKSSSSTTPRSSIPAPVKSLLPPQRQGTFTKEEPSLIPVPSVPSVSAGSTPTKQGTKQGCKQTPGITLRNKSQPNIKRPGVRSSLSNSSLKDLSTPGGLNRRSYADLSSTQPDPGRLSQRSSQSNSSSSLHSSSSVTCVKQPAAGKKAVAGPTTTVTSKIANLWKKVEDSKKGAGKKDTRVWIAK